MLDVINAVLGAVATKDIIPVLTHVYVTPDGVQGSNGRISIHYPTSTPVDRAVCLPGRKLQQALKRGKDHKWNLTDANLTLTAGRLRVRLPIDPAPYPVTAPSDSALYPIGDAEKFLETLSILRPFVAKDGSRPWACGVLVKGVYMYATNNVAIARMKWGGLQGAGLPGVNVPMDALDELLRLNKAGHTPQGLRVDDTSLTVHFDTGVWMRTTLLSNDWPDADAMLGDRPETDPLEGDILHELWQGADAVVPFSADEKAPVVEFTEEGLRTREGTVQAAMDIEGLPVGAYRSEVLSLVLNVADRVWFEMYPKPVRFSAEDDIDGVFVGVRA